MSERTNLMSAGTLIGDSVRNPEGEKLGTVEEMMIDLTTGRVGYVVLASGGFMGMGEKYFALPWEAMRLDMDSHEFVVELSAEKLADAPGFDKDNWPDMNDVAWGRDVYAYYGVEPFWMRGVA